MEYWNNGMLDNQDRSNGILEYWNVGILGKPIWNFALHIIPLFQSSTVPCPFFLHYSTIP